LREVVKFFYVHLTPKRLGLGISQNGGHSSAPAYLLLNGLAASSDDVEVCRIVPGERSDWRGHNRIGKSRIAYAWRDAKILVEGLP